jgi:hypothetical protein
MAMGKTGKQGMFNFRLNAESENAIQILKAEGYTIGTVLRRALCDKAAAVKGGR